MNAFFILLKYFILEVIVTYLVLFLTNFWTQSDHTVKIIFTIAPSLLEFFFLLIILFSQGLLYPFYGICQTLFHALFYTGSFAILILGDFMGHEEITPNLSFANKLFLIMAIRFYFSRFTGKLKIYILPFGPIATAWIMQRYYNYGDSTKAVLYGALMSFIVNNFIFFPDFVDAQKKIIKDNMDMRRDMYLLLATLYHLS